MTTCRFLKIKSAIYYLPTRFLGPKRLLVHIKKIAPIYNYFRYWYSNARSRDGYCRQRRKIQLCGSTRSNQ